MKTLTVNTADWDGPADLPAGWLIANAPRPLPGGLRPSFPRMACKRGTQTARPERRHPR